MNSKGIMWSDVKNLLIALAIIGLIIWMLGGTVAKGVVKQSDCIKNKGYCAEVCGPGAYQMLQFNCGTKGKVCCFDENAVRGEGPPEMTVFSNGVENLPCNEVQAEINRAYMVIWQNLAAANTSNDNCRVVGDNYYSVNPCDLPNDKPCVYSSKIYPDKDDDCATLDALINRRDDECTSN